jgi:hypothetical protein
MKKLRLTIFAVIISICITLTTNAAIKNNVKIQTKKQPVQTTTIQKSIPEISESAYILTPALEIVANPDKYLNKKVKIKAKFDKFSTLGLDYKPAYKSSEKYITFLIKRDDVINHTVPLSEMKNFIDRETAEKYIDLKSGDDIEYYGTVFSTALSDVWINVEKFTVLKKQEKTTDSVKK